MNAKSLMVFLVVAGAVVWFALKDKAPEPPPQSLTAGQQQQMQKAGNLGKEMQQSLDQRTQDPANQ